MYRDLSAAGVRCEVAAPSKLQKPAGDRVKTDARDALHLARLLRLDEITSVAIPALIRKRPGIWCGPGRTDAGT